MEGWLTVEKHIIAGLNVSVKHLVFVIVPEVSCMRDSLFFGQAVQFDNFSIFFKEVCSWVFASIDDVTLEFFEVVLIDVLLES